jgi:hypothetical protein
MSTKYLSLSEFNLEGQYKYLQVLLKLPKQLRRGPKKFAASCAQTSSVPLRRCKILQLEPGELINVFGLSRLNSRTSNYCHN